MKTPELLCITLLFVLCFAVTEFLVEHITLGNPFQRLLARIGFQFQLYGLVYLLFDSFDVSRRLKKLEQYLSVNNPEESGSDPSEKEGK